MTNQKTLRRSLLSSVIALLVCFAMLLGTTFAWFTDSVKSGVNRIVAGNLDVELWHSTYLDSAANSTWGLGFGYSEEKGVEVDENTQLFLNEDGNPILWEPGSTAVENFRIKNVGSLAVKFAFKVEVANATKTPEGKDLTEVLDLYIDEINWQDNGVPSGKTIVVQKLGDGFTFEGEILAGENYDFWVGLEWQPSENDNAYNVKGGLDLDLGVTLLATQLAYEKDGYDGNHDGDAQYPEVPGIPPRTDVWDGTADYSWYDPDKTEYTLSSAEALVGFSNLLGGNVDSVTRDSVGTCPVSFDGKTVTLTCDVDLAGAKTMGDSFAPIGSTGKRDDKNRLIVEPFTGIFDGGDHTIANLYQSGWDFGYEWGKYGSIGLFSELKDATVKNVTISGMESQVEGGDVSFIAGSATGNCTFENITIANSTVATYNNGCGGIIGWSGEGTYTFKNIKLGEDVVLGGLWGSFDSSIGGIVGQAEPGATYNFENVNVACRLDVYNDCTASYDYYNYRMCGMLIGRLEETTTIEGINYPDTSKYNITCNNVTVTYGDWANYHYCEPTPGLNGGRGMRVEPGYAYDGLPADYDHSQCVDNHMNLIPFDQIFGGDQIAVKGLKTYDGVTVDYNNK